MWKQCTPLEQTQFVWGIIMHQNPHRAIVGGVGLSPVWKESIAPWIAMANFSQFQLQNLGLFLVLTVMILSFRTDRPGQTVQTQIRLLLEEQSDQALHCLPFRLHHLDSLLYGRAEPHNSNYRVNTTKKFLGVRIFSNFTVYLPPVSMAILYHHYFYLSFSV